MAAILQQGLQLPPGEGLIGTTSSGNADDGSVGQFLTASVLSGGAIALVDDDGK